MEILTKEYIFTDTNWEMNNYEDFLKSISLCEEQETLSKYTIQDLKANNIITYKLVSENIGFALKPDSLGFDMILLHNSSKIKGIIDNVIKYAISKGGNHCDYYETDKLKHIYSKYGFVEYQRDKFNRMYADENFNYKKYGTPDIVYVKLP